MRIAYCGHSYHRATGSPAFLLDAFRRLGDVELFWDDSWLTGRPFDPAPIVDGGFDAVIVWQVEDAARRIAESKLANVTFFPMFDSCHGLPDSYWRAFAGVKIVCFSSTLHERLQRLGLSSRFVRYFPDPNAFEPLTPDAGLAGYFWQRQQDVTWKTIRRLLGDAPFRSFTLHAAVDPSYGYFVTPSADDVRRYAVRTTHWFPSRDDAIADVFRHNVYFAPRLQEGIGLSFLEAMAMGFLVVAPDRPTMNEYIVSGVNGLLYDPLDPRPLDFSRHAEIGGRARRTVEIGWRKWRRCLDPLLDFVFTPRDESPVRARFDAFDPLALELLRQRAPRRELPAAGGGISPPPRHAPNGKAPEGGRRLREGSRTDDGPSPLVTVAVVTRNAAETLAATLESVLAQDYPCLEIVVLDGASEDSTLDIVRRYEDRLDYWRSEKDGGPYEAMNAAAAVAAGRYVIFMNAGDRFQTADALSLALDGAPQDADVIVGHHVYRDVGGYDGLRLSASFSETCSRLRHGDVDWRWLSRVPCHQATLTLTELLRRNPYRADLRIAADHELLYRVAKQGARFHHSLAVIATYVGGGLSSRNQKRCFEEWRQVALEYSEEPEAVRRRFHVMRAEMRRSELPRLTLGQLLLCLAVRVPGSTRELKRRIRTRLAAESARRSERPVHVDFGAAKLRNESPGIEKLSRAELSKLEMPREHAQFAD